MPCHQDHLESDIRALGEELCLRAKGEALARIEIRDPRDWPILALDHPIWTEDQDFFGTGVPTWTDAGF